MLPDGAGLRSRERAFAALDLVVRRHVEGLLQGDHSGTRLGPGGEPAEVVRYSPGEDDVRRIDWNVTARSSEPHVWRSRADHELDTWVLLDATASMDFGTTTMEKRDLGAWAGAVVALLADGPGNRVGVARHTAGGLRWEPARPARVSARRITRAALNEGAHPEVGGGVVRGGVVRSDVTAAPVVAVESRSESAEFAQSLSGFERRFRRPGLRVVISDFVEPDGRSERPFDWETPLRRLTARHDVIAVEVLDPRELELPDVGMVLLTDPETGRQHEVWTGAKTRARYAQVAAEHRAAVAEALRSAGADHLQLRTDSDWIRDLARHVQRRRRVPRPRRRIR
ncbi:uncharacterized protein (DUF58 family) [Kineosphaera limosa]|uniref:DUF58 domain-containing protein n=1 Tax=Kineosphaera limosa NBRC 100340 TaxID=1184609 RepID=K6X0Q6_9MICO|nr:DUF58 domain-containing protein [Kineosphaera limosa]NYE01875.1 uncharacterized protein (DUF58 family) [Kineosphaera limosa]GAB97942.1 hypothetical protein KILIM_089_00120 [Kineosphaera limosa NBRC 100340]